MKKRLSFLAIFCILIQACSTAPGVVGIKKATVSEGKNADHGEYNIHVVSHGWHTGIILPCQALNNKIEDLGERFPSSVYYEMGWGDAGFYQAEEITSKLTLQALFSSTGAVIHIVGFSSRPEDYFPGSEMSMLKLDRKGFEGLLAFIGSSFFKDASGNPVRLKPGIYGNSQFYKATGRYHAFNTCNTWTAKAIASSGFDINYRLKLTSSGVMGYLERLSQAK